MGEHEGRSASSTEADVAERAGSGLSRSELLRRAAVGAAVTGTAI